MRNPEIAEAWHRSAEIVTALEKWLEGKQQRHSRLNYKKTDKLRLLRFRTWEFRYRVELEEMFDILIPILRAKMERKRQKHGIGVSITALVGEGAEEILKEELAKKYPEGSNITLWKDRERRRQLERERLEDSDGMATRSKTAAFSILEADSLDTYLTKYRCKVKSAKEKLVSVETSKARRLRRYRGNPWL